MTMRKIVYSGGELVTTEAVAHVILEYAAQLGNHGRAATLLVPAVGLADGEQFVELLVGPASQLAAEPVESDEEPPDDDEFLRDVRARIDASLSRPWTGEDWSSGL